MRFSDSFQGEINRSSHPPSPEPMRRDIETVLQAHLTTQSTGQTALIVQNSLNLLRAQPQRELGGNAVCLVPTHPSR